MNRVLFLCNGNYYRSRFAEEYFNHQADRFALPWEADSQALAQDLAATGNQGPISTFAVTELQRRAIPIRGGARHPSCAQPTDFETAQRIIAVSRREHEPMLREHFPEVFERIQYFEMGDLDVETPATAITRLTQAIDLEIDALRRRHRTRRLRPTGPAVRAARPSAPERVQHGRPSFRPTTASISRPSVGAAAPGPRALSNAPVSADARFDSSTCNA